MCKDVGEEERGEKGKTTSQSGESGKQNSLTIADMYHECLYGSLSLTKDRTEKVKRYNFITTSLS